LAPNENAPAFTCSAGAGGVGGSAPWCGHGTGPNPPRPPRAAGRGQRSQPPSDGRAHIPRPYGALALGLWLAERVCGLRWRRRRRRRRRPVASGLGHAPRRRRAPSPPRGLPEPRAALSQGLFSVSFFGSAKWGKLVGNGIFCRRRRGVAGHLRARRRPRPRPAPSVCHGRSCGGRPRAP
jgi:hypothetical protein